MPNRDSKILRFFFAGVALLLLAFFLSPSLTGFSQDQDLIEVAELFDLEEENKKEESKTFVEFEFLNHGDHYTGFHDHSKQFLKDDFNYFLWSHDQIGKFIRLEIHSLIFYS